MITADMEAFIQKLKTKVRVGLVGGSDLNKISEQMSAETDGMYSLSCYLYHIIK